ncbi:acyltransferase family protein [Mycetocola zhadangensis]|uniref:acyltransferase family protein n=1 Tax=Mycetocola zhadangensis TaxID=1164595 RepID=UPI003A4E2801
MKQKHKFRADIQGLRAFAVIVVIFDHMFHWPSGGFVGVDVFFVISGFLITGLLIREWERSGRISFTDFYKRRVKRILPASSLVLFVTVTASLLLLNASRAWGVLWDGLWAFLFVGNWRFAAVGTDYFAADGTVSPLQHYWSLAVEEQFYFVWPWIMLLALALFAKGRRRNRARIVAGSIILILSTASFLWAMFETGSAPTVAYFSTFARAWELGVGALIALATPLLMRIPNALRPSLAWVGIIGMVASLFLLSDSSPFPAPWALLPVLGTGLVIAAGIGGEQRYLAPLTNPLASYLGNISFSLYLWHMPVIILLGPVLPLNGPLGSMGLLGITAGLSIAAYHLWEDAVRKSPWLDGDRQAWKKFQLPPWYRNAAMATFAALTVLFVVASMMYAQNRVDQTLSSAREADDILLELDKKREAASHAENGLEQTVTEAATANLVGGPEVQGVISSVEEALTLTTWGAAEAAVQDATGSVTNPEGVAQCQQLRADHSRCYFGSADALVNVVLTGDSISTRWVGSLIPLLDELDWRLHVRGQTGCPFVDVERGFNDVQTEAACEENKTSVLDYVEAEKPDILLISNTAVLPAKPSGELPSVSEWQAGLTTYLARVPDSTQAVVLSAPPADKSIRTCYTPGSTPASCLGTKTKKWLSSTAAERKAADESGAKYIDTSVLFCALDRCPSVVHGIPVKHDPTHLTLEYAEYIAPALGELLRTALES